MSTENPGPELTTTDEARSERILSRVEVLAFEPDSRPGEWRARQVALRRSLTGPTEPPRPEPPLIVAPKRRSAVGTPDSRSRSAAMPIRLPDAGGRLPEAGVTDPARVTAPPERQGRQVAIEVSSADPFSPQSARYFLTLSEQRRDLPDRRTLWAIKEAARKALGCDDSVSFTSMELRFDEHGSLYEVIFAGRSHPAGAMVLRPWSSRILAVVWVDDGTR